MNKHSKIHIFLLSIVIFLSASCFEPEEFPLEPEIEFISFFIYVDGTTSQEFGIFKIGFTDGDGNLGLAESDTLGQFAKGSKYYYNFFLDFFIKENGAFVPYQFPDSSFTFHSRIPRVHESEEPKAVRGEIDIEINTEIMAAVLKGDTIKLQAFIVDRALNESNTVESNEIIF